MRTPAADGPTTRRPAIETSLLAGIVSAAPLPLWVIDPGGAVVLANRAALAFLGHRGDGEVVGGPSHDLLHHCRPDGSEYLARSCPIVRAQGRRSTSVRHEWFVTQQGDLRPVSWTTEPVGTGGMTLLHFASVTPEAPTTAKATTTNDHLRRLRARPRPQQSRDGVRERAREIIDRGFGDPHFSASVLAEDLHLSARTLQVLFQDVGSSPAAEIRRVRLDHAFALLRGGHSVRSACLLSGFLDPDTFGRTFRRHFGYAPSQVRGPVRTGHPLLMTPPAEYSGPHARP